MSKTPAKTPKSKNINNKESLQVYCRLRPIGPSDVSCIQIISNNKLLLTTPENSVNYRGGVCKETQYSFKQVFTDTDAQKTVFDEVAQPLVDALLRGRNGLLFTYGVTGSGKTYTMTGNRQDGGIMPRCVDVIFNTISSYQAGKLVFKPDHMNGFEVQSERDAAREREECLRAGGGLRSGKLRKNLSDEDVRSLSRNKDPSKIEHIEEDNSYAVFVQYIEIYNNSVFDLLEDVSLGDPSQRLQSKIIREDAGRNMYVHGVTEVEVKDADEAFEMFCRGQKRKRMAGTTLNTDSSRSHSVFTIRLVQAPLDSTGENVLQHKNAIAISQLSLVDLAGSERTNRTKNCGQRLREAGNINNSLMTLRSCLEILRENQMSGAGNKMIPYRESKLTHLFKNYFDGEGDIRMVVCVNPREEDYDETVQVMKFAEVSQEIMVTKPTPLKLDTGLANGLTPGRRRANQAYKQAVQELNEISKEKENVNAHVPFDGNVIYNLDFPFPKLELLDPSQSEVNNNLLSYLRERAAKLEALKQDINAKCDNFRAALMNSEQHTFGLQQENLSYKAMLEQERMKLRNMESKVVAMDSNENTLKRKLEEVEQENKRLKRDVDNTEVQLDQINSEKERTKRKLNAKYNAQTKQMEKKMKQTLQEKLTAEQELENKERKLRQVKNILKEKNGGARTPFKTPYSSKSEENLDVSSGSSTVSSSSVSGTPVSSVKRHIHEWPATARTLRARTPGNARYRRSQSQDRWLDHQAVKQPTPLGTIFQPVMKKKTSMTKITSPKDMAKTTKYCLTTQSATKEGNLETHLYKGDIVPTAGGGSQVILNDVETLTQSSPVTSPSHYVTATESTTSDRVLRDVVKTRCAVGMQGSRAADVRRKL